MMTTSSNPRTVTVTAELTALNWAASALGGELDGIVRKLLAEIEEAKHPEFDAWVATGLVSRPDVEGAKASFLALAAVQDQLLGCSGNVRDLEERWLTSMTIETARMRGEPLLPSIDMV